ncbi:Shikimate dehydrogenase (NADP(+)) [Geodia barretti]|uniref:shikimate dehydrogenase (NADP(+)) n=1 Tax=Geodia barretti TaxID=519541 RepID=A0AA35W1C7_GEOBA|nr:Shikimate dehydrogenase (NADP(+)) [Geodia barretti]
MQITGQTKIVGIIGAPIEHSRSPQIHNAAIAALGLDYVYVPFHVQPDNLGAAIEGFKAANVVGINVTIPHKQNVITYLDEISREATLIGAVNTLIFKDGAISGENTDAPGFLQAMQEEGLDVPEGGTAVVIGAGGSARAIVVALALAGVQTICITNRTVSRAVALATDLSGKTGLDDPKLSNAVGTSQLIVNTASTSMDVSYPLLIDPEWLEPQSIVYDIVYTPPETRLLRAAAEKGCHTIGGLGMLVHQGAIAFEKWTGVNPPVESMRQALQGAFDQK